MKVESGHTGLKSKLYKCVYVDGKLQDRTLLNSDTYNASKTVYRVGTGAAAPVETTPAETAAPAETEAVAPAETAGTGDTGAWHRGNGAGRTTAG